MRRILLSRRNGLLILRVKLFNNLSQVRMRLSHFDPVGPLDRIPATVICSKEAIATARDSVAQSVALIKNDAKVRVCGQPSIPLAFI